MRLILTFAVALLLSAAPPALAACQGVWLCRDDILRLPMDGPAWQAVRGHADKPVTIPDLSDQEDTADVETLARALVWARSGDERYRRLVIAAIDGAIGSERGGRTLALGRNLPGLVVAADIVGLPPALENRFRAWLRGVVDLNLQGNTLRLTHARRPNNWGTHAGAARLAAALYLGNEPEVRRIADILRGWLGERGAYAGFRFGERDWQADRLRPVGINPAGASRDGHSIDGVVADDQRRCCPGGAFHWPPPRENYVYEALQGVVAQAVMLDHAGYDVWSWGDRALLRAFRWLHDHADYPAAGDDTWQPHVINHAYGTAFPAPVPSRPGKNIGFTDWIYGGGDDDVAAREEPPFPGQSE